MAKKTKRTERERLCSYIKQMAEDAVASTGTWEQNQLKWMKMRYRIKKTKTFPFVGCANLRMPTIETKLRKLKAALANVIFGVRPIVQVIPTPSGNWQSAIKVEKFLDHLLMNVMQIKKKAIIAIDQMLEKGFYLLKPYWRLEIVTRSETIGLKDISVDEAMWLFNPNTSKEQVVQAIIKKLDVDMNERVKAENFSTVENMCDEIMSGKDEVSADFLDVVYNSPDSSLVEPERAYVPTDAGFDPQSAQWIIHEFFMPLETIKQNATWKQWDIGEIADIEYKSTEADSKDNSTRFRQIDSEKDLREGIDSFKRTGKIKIWEFYGWYDINGDNAPEKCVITTAPDFDKVLKAMPLPFYSGKFPFVKLFYELTDDRWFSHRGLPELIEDVVKEIDIQHCQKIDYQTMMNSPMYTHRAGMVSKNTLQFVFGQSLPVHGMQPLDDIIRPLNRNNPNVEFSYEREQMLLESKVEELVGQIDFTLQSMINKRQPRTLGEVQLQQQNMQQVFSLDAEQVRMAFEELFNWVWELWCQYGEDSYEFAYFGKEGWEPIRLTKEEVQGKYKITVRGNDQNTNPQVRQQKAQMILMAMNNPIAMQSGVITPANIANGYKRFYQELDIPNWEELVSMPQPPQPPPPQVRMKMDDLTDAEQAQVLAKQGIKPDIQGRSLKSRAKIQEKQLEQESETIGNMGELADILDTVGGNGKVDGETS